MTELTPAEIHARSESLMPAFALINAGFDQPGAYEALDATWQERLFVTGGSEQFIARFMCIKVAGFAALPAEDDTQDERHFSLVPVFQGAGLLALTTTRLVGLLGMGSSAVGEIDADRSQALVCTFPLRSIVTVELRRKRGFTGLKELGVAFTGTEGLLAVDFDAVVDDRRNARKVKQSDAMRTVLRATAEEQARQGIANLQSLQEAVSEPWRNGDDDDLLVRLPHQDGLLSSMLLDAPPH